MTKNKTEKAFEKLHKDLEKRGKLLELKSYTSHIPSAIKGFLEGDNKLNTKFYEVSEKYRCLAYDNDEIVKVYIFESKYMNELSEEQNSFKYYLKSKLKDFLKRCYGNLSLLVLDSDIDNLVELYQSEIPEYLKRLYIAETYHSLSFLVRAGDLGNCGLMSIFNLNGYPCKEVTSGIDRLIENMMEEYSISMLVMSGEEDGNVEELVGYLRKSFDVTASHGVENENSGNTIYTWTLTL